MIKEILTLRGFVGKLNKLGITSVKGFLERCQDPVKREELRQQLDVQVTAEQWEGAVAVVKDLFK
jgi:hypothetical protein